MGERKSREAECRTKQGDTKGKGREGTEPLDGGEEEPGRQMRDRRKRGNKEKFKKEIQGEENMS